MFLHNVRHPLKESTSDGLGTLTLVRGQLAWEPIGLVNHYTCWLALTGAFEQCLNDPGVH